MSDAESKSGPAEPRPSVPSIEVIVDLGAATHPGHTRPNNEDSYLVARATRALEVVQTNLPTGAIPAWASECSFGFVVADGMGGRAAGEVASRLALRTVIEHTLATADWVMRDTDCHRATILERIAERFSVADQAVKDQALLRPPWSGMGTTMTLALSNGADLFLGHVGDSRAYLLRSARLEALTRDHSLAQQLADAGVISHAQAATHHMRNVLVRHLGAGGATADVHHVGLESGDQVLLCTDGLTEMVDNMTISQVLQTEGTAQAACDRLIAAALEAGGSDNVTAIVARYRRSTTSK